MPLLHSDFKAALPFQRSLRRQTKIPLFRRRRHPVPPQNRRQNHLNHHHRVRFSCKHKLKRYVTNKNLINAHANHPEYLLVIFRESPSLWNNFCLICTQTKTRKSLLLTSVVALALLIQTIRTETSALSC